MTDRSERADASSAESAHQRAPGPVAAWPATEPRDIAVSSGQARLAVDLRGGNLRRLVVGEWDVLDGYPAGTIPSGAAAESSYPGRIASVTAAMSGRVPSCN